ncbi:MAG: PDDEXK nuclease domain-containing protein, partial [Synergistaceae bacterium]|nr:PDDEXK nuclease domain-containing protein [Synergistaceae bacterium]
MVGNKNFDFVDASRVIKDAIFRSRYQAAKLVNKELLSLYYGVGKYVSENSRNGYWGQGAIKQISETLQRELPGLRGFSEGSIKKMRLFYEEWSTVFTNRSLTTNDFGRRQIMDTVSDESDGMLAITPYRIGLSIDLGLLSRQLGNYESPGFFADEFLRVGFTHQYTIIAQEKSLDARFFYIAQCAAGFWTVEALKSNLRGGLYAKKGTMPNNFLQTLPESEQARRAVRLFKDEYFLDYINIEDENDPDERVFERSIVANIKQFILTFGNKFCFIGNQYRVVVDEQEYFIDLLFFNRELHCLVAVELKRGKFKPSQLGQLFFYLSALDEYVRQPDEAPSIGIILCREASRNTVEFAVRDYTKPMGV